jgi:tetratricopeptide (TPR) repeat protein
LGNRYVWNALAGALIVFAINSYASYWIRTNDPEARTVIAARLFAMRDTRRAESLLRSAIEIDPNNVDARQTLAQYLIERRQLTEARKWLDLAPGQPAGAPRRMLIGQLESFAGNSQLAKREVERAIELDPQLADAYIARAELARQAGDYAAAIAAYRDALAFNPYTDAVHQQLAAAYEKMGNTANADRHRKYFAMLRSIAPAK